MLLLLWKVPIRLLSGPFSACKAGSEAFLEMGTTEGKVPQSSLREERNLAESFGSHKNQLRLTNIRGPIKKYGKTAKFVFLEKINKIAFKYNGTPKNGHNNQKCLFGSNVALKSKPPSIWNLKIPQKSMITL